MSQPTPIYTAAPLARSQTTSQQFKDFGAHNLAPTSIGEVKVAGISAKIVTSMVLLLAQITMVMGSMLTGELQTTLKNLHAVKNTVTYTLLVPLPPMIIYIKKYSEQVSTRLEALGFIRQSSGKYQFYKGPGTTQAIRDTAAIEGVEPDAHSPKGCVSIHGAMTFYVLNALASAAFSALLFIGPETDNNPLFPTSFIDFSITQNTFDSLPSKGLFLAYFDGLLLPDRSETIKFVIEHYSSLLGNTLLEITQHADLLMSGWASLHNTLAGRAFSHMFFCIRLATACCYQIRPVFLNNEYTGCVIVGNALVLVGRTLAKSVTKEILQSQITGMVSHTASLEQICAILSGISLRDGEGATTAVVAPTLITGPRLLQRQFTLRKITPETIGQCRPLMRKLKFTQTYWSITDTTKVSLAIRSIMRGESLPGDAPLYFQSGDAMFTEETIIHTLAVFGPKAISLLGHGNTMSRPIGPNMYSEVKNPGNLAGIPIFGKPIQESYEDWKKLKNDQLVFWSHGGKDKMGRMRVKGNDAIVLFGTDAEKDIMKSLVDFKNASKSAKRKAETEEKAIDADVAKKRQDRRVKGMGMIGLEEIVGGKSTDVDNDDMIADDSFFD